MGLADRHYMRSPYRGLNWSATLILLLANVAIFVLTLTVLPRLMPVGYLVLSVEGLKHGFVWQLLTFQFLHANWLHLLFNSLALYFFGNPVETVLGRPRFLALYFGSGAIGGLVQMVFALALPKYFGGQVVGASAGVAGLVAAFAVVHWEQRFMLLLYFFPTTLRGRTLFWISSVIALFGMALAVMKPGADNVAYAAHLGGLLTGFAFVRFDIGIRRLAWPWQPLRTRQRKRELVKAASVRIPRWPREQESPPEVPEEEFISREVDPILDKISAHGIQSLTERERKILEAARNRMAKR